MLNISVVDDYLKQTVFLQGSKHSLEKEKEDIVKNVKEAKEWLAKEGDYVKFLQHLQNMLHQKNIGAFSELLSFFVKDVLKKDKDIVLDLYTYHNLPALKIESSNNGKRENIIEGNGGSIANIVSTGLRLIALSRLPNRKFIILDEPDCWLKPEHIPLFAQIIGEISAQLNIQTVIISHHHWSFFKNYGRVIELKKEGPHLTTEIIHDTESDIKDIAKKDLIKSITLKHFMSHYNTVYDLHPHLTCIVGENDIGKSVIGAAMKALAYGDSSDSYISHDEREAQVIIELNNEDQVLWQRFRQTDQDNPQKVKYSLYQNKILSFSEFSSHESPEFIKRRLNICTVEDIDVHIGNQKQPVFLLSSDTRPQERAKILSLGKDSLTIQKTMETIKSKKKQYKHVEKEGERRFTKIEQELLLLENIDSLVDRVEQLKDEIFIFNKKIETQNEMNELIENIELLENIVNVGKIDFLYVNTPIIQKVDEIENLIEQYNIYQKLSEISLISFENIQINLQPTLELTDIINQIEKLEKISNLNLIDINIPEFKILDTTDINYFITEIEKLIHLENIKPINVNIEKPLISDTQDIANIINQINEMEKNLNALEKEQSRLNSEKENIDAEFEEYFKIFGTKCPTCHQAADKEHLRGEHGN